MGLKIAVIGGGSTYTPELVQGVVDRTATLPIDELVLHDVDAERLEVVGGLAERILRRQAWPGRLVSTTNQDQAIDGASFVLVQLRVGGQQARYSDETLPHRFGCIGQETTGPGGFAKALRTVPVVLDLAAEVGRRGAPDAWIVDFTNPVGIVTQALLDAGHRAIGLCNVAIGVQRRMAARFGVTPDRIELEHVGLNHLSWIRAIRVDGVDRLPTMLAEDAKEIAADVDTTEELLRALGAIPSYYLHYYYATREVLDKQLAGGTRAEDVMAIERELLEMYRDPNLDRKPALLEQRGGAFYSEAAAQLIASLHAGTGDIQVVDVRNDGALPDLPDHAVVEVPARIDRDGAHPIAQAPLAPEMRGLVQAAKAYEELAVIAATTGDRRAALLALLANPLVPDLRAADGLLAAILETNAAFLPRFATSA
ncbi:MAG: 6-phospho-beta-glucosidase [Chloroflexota bacterium]|jgi:6-phospho-beta-glucosidase|nr:6-phospho-beta-glucosidase [Chloroflexota bacterium]